MQLNSQKTSKFGEMGEENGTHGMETGKDKEIARILWESINYSK
mgnify:CR=1 FL=1